MRGANQLAIVAARPKIKGWRLQDRVIRPRIPKSSRMKQARIRKRRKEESRILLRNLSVRSRLRNNNVQAKWVIRRLWLFLPGSPIQGSVNGLLYTDRIVFPEGSKPCGY
ncbi:hypothetical protein SESBI_17344 [Sesbania bispinosa]|nr:hypothetical protein SESBI_17344 [Sesbania bispinosa]